MAVSDILRRGHVGDAQHKRHLVSFLTGSMVIQRIYLNVIALTCKKM